MHCTLDLSSLPRHIVGESVTPNTLPSESKFRPIDRSIVRHDKRPLSVSLISLLKARFGNDLSPLMSFLGVRILRVHVCRLPEQYHAMIAHASAKFPRLSVNSTDLELIRSVCRPFASLDRSSLCLPFSLVLTHASLFHDRSEEDREGEKKRRRADGLGREQCTPHGKSGAPTACGIDSVRRHVTYR